jgi:hypothetical protein
MTSASAVLCTLMPCCPVSRSKADQGVEFVNQIGGVGHGVLACGKPHSTRGSSRLQELHESIEHPGLWRAHSGRLAAKASIPGLFVVGVAQHLEQLVNHRRIALLGTFYGLLRQIVAQNIAGIDGVHARDARRSWIRCRRTHAAAQRAARRSKAGRGWRSVFRIVESFVQRSSRARADRRGPGGGRNSVMSISARCSRSNASSMSGIVVAPGRSRTWRQRALEFPRVDRFVETFSWPERADQARSRPSASASRSRFQRAISG